MLLLVQVVPILRAGLVLLENAATLLPASETYHLGYVRDDETLQVGTLLSVLRGSIRGCCRASVCSCQ